MSKRCLITGSSGFIGQALSKHVSGQGYEVVALPRNLLYQSKELAVWIDQLKPELIYHLAAYGNKYDQRDQRTIIKANIMALSNLLLASKNTHYSAFINFGSSSEYGRKDRPMRETDSLDGESFYAVTKAAGTMLAKAFAHRYQKPIVTVRPFSVYGLSDDPRKFIPTAVSAFRDNTPLQLAPGVHDWIYLLDFLDGLTVVTKHAAQLRGQAVNIGSGTQTSNHAIVSMLRRISGKPGVVKQTARMRDYDTSESWVADITLLKSLGWKPKTEIEDGLTRMYYGNNQ